MASTLSPPCATQDQNVGKPVVVVVGLHDVQPAGFAGKTGLFSDVGKSAITVVVEEAKLNTGIPVGAHQIKIPVAIEIFPVDNSRQAE